MSGKNVPVLRFPGFEGEWIPTNLDNLCSMQAGKFIAASKITDDCADNLFPCFGGNGVRGFVPKKTHAGRFPLIGRQGALCGNVQLASGEFYATEHALVVSAKNNAAVDWLYHLLRRLNLNQYATGQAQPGLSVEVLKRVETSRPRSLEEQGKIAAFLGAADEKISGLEKKRALLTDYKRGVTQKLFSQELRFKDDQGDDFPDWEEKRVSDVFKVTRGKVLAVPKMTREPEGASVFPVYSSQTRANGLTGYFTNFLYENAITWTTDGANAGDVQYRSGKFYCTNVCGVLLSENGYANKCVAEMLNRVTENYVSYVGNPKLMNNVMGEIRLRFPHPSEQKKIADFLSAIDTQITLAADEIAAAKSFKKGLLQQMFV